MTSKSGPITICTINLKGGVGKSTITALLARFGFRKGLDVLAIDLDPQANLSQALMGERYKTFISEQRPSIVEIFNGYLPPNSSSSSAAALGATDGVETIGTSQNGSFQLIPSRFDFSDHLTGSLRPDPKILAKVLSQRFADKDIVFIDCAPTESVLTRAAYHASGLVLVPVKPEFFATIGFPLLQESLRTFRSGNRGHKIEVLGIVINNPFYHGGNDGGPEKQRSLKEIKAEATKHGWDIFKKQIPFSRGFPKIMRGDYSYSGNAYMFDFFAKEFYDKLGL